MPETLTAPVSLADLTRRIAGVEGFDAVARALAEGRSATIDGAWGSSGACAIAALAEATTLVVIAHPRDQGQAESRTSPSASGGSASTALDEKSRFTRSAEKPGGSPLSSGAIGAAES